MRLMLLSERKILAADLGKAGHFSGMDVFQDVEIVETSIDGRVRGPFQSVDTRSFSSSNQLMTMLILQISRETAQLYLPSAFLVTGMNSN